MISIDMDGSTCLHNVWGAITHHGVCKAHEPSLIHRRAMEITLTASHRQSIGRHGTLVPGITSFCAVPKPDTVAQAKSSPTP